MTKIATGHLQRRIREYFDYVDLDVVCQKRRDAYAIYWVDDRLPLAKLRPTGRGDDVEVYYWDDGHWESVSELGLVLPLDESLQYITDDPDDVFFEPFDADNDVQVRIAPEYAAAIRHYQGFTCLCVLVGGAVGGMMSGAGSGGAWGALVGMMMSIALAWTLRGARIWIFYATAVGIPVVLLGGAVGVLGGALNEAVAHRIWGPVCGCLSGIVFGLLIFSDTWLTRATGLLVGLTLAARFVELTQLRDHFVGLALVVIAACVSASFYSWMVQRIWDPVGQREQARRLTG